MLDDFLNQQHCDEFECDHQFNAVECDTKRCVYVCGLCGESYVDDYLGRGEEPQTVETREQNKIASVQRLAEQDMKGGEV